MVFSSLRISKGLSLPLLILAVCVLIGMSFMVNKPKAERKPIKIQLPAVDVLEIQPQDYQIRLNTRGTVEPRTQSTLIPEVSGRVVSINENLRNGGFFEKGDLLVSIDPRNYQITKATAEAEVTQAKLAQQEEQALADQARMDWEKLGFEEQPQDLVMRLPQLANANSRVAAKEAQLRLAEINLERTQLRAPFAGRVLEKQVDVGQFVAPGNILATLYAVDFAEIRLPISDRQASFMDLPEAYRGEEIKQIGPEVDVLFRQGEQSFSWQGRVVRSEGAVDTRSRQLFVVAQVDNPYQRHPDSRPPLKVGQFVEAVIKGHLLKEVYLLPRAALRGENEVLLITGGNKLKRLSLEILWSDQDQVVVKEGLQAGDLIALTPVPLATTGLTVEIKRRSSQRHTNPGE